MSEDETWKRLVRRKDSLSAAFHQLELKLCIARAKSSGIFLHRLAYHLDGALNFSYKFLKYRHSGYYCLSRTWYEFNCILN